MVYFIDSKGVNSSPLSTSRILERRKKLRGRAHARSLLSPLRVPLARPIKTNQITVACLAGYIVSGCKGNYNFALWVQRGREIWDGHFITFVQRLLKSTFGVCFYYCLADERSKDRSCSQQSFCGHHRSTSQTFNRTDTCGQERRGSMTSLGHVTWHWLPDWVDGQWMYNSTTNDMFETPGVLKTRA